MKITSKSITINISTKELDALSSLLFKKLPAKEKVKVINQIKILYKILDEAYKNEQYDLIIENKILKNANEKINRKNAIGNIMLNYYEQNITAAAANLIIDPEPVEIDTSKGSYFVSITNILAIKSVSRLKKIYLNESVSEKNGGPKSLLLYVNRDDTNFNVLLNKIQGRSHHLLRVHTSNVINIYCYSLSKKGLFILNDEHKKSENKVIHKIKTDGKFDAKLYSNRLIEIKKLAELQIGFKLNAQKISEISRSIKS